MNTKAMKVKMLRALKKHRGLVSTSAVACKMSRSTHYLWMNEDEDYKTKVDELMLLEVEYVESKLQNLIENENPSAIQFYLKNKSKDFQPTLKVDGDIKTEITVNPIKIVNPGKKD